MTAEAEKGVSMPQKADADPQEGAAASHQAAALCQEGAKSAAGAASVALGANSALCRGIRVRASVVECRGRGARRSLPGRHRCRTREERTEADEGPQANDSGVAPRLATARHDAGAGIESRRSLWRHTRFRTGTRWGGRGDSWRLRGPLCDCGTKRRFR